MAVIRIVVDGQPVAKGRPRFNRATGAAYTPAHTRKYESHIRMAAQHVMDGERPLQEPLAVVLTAFLPVPQSWSGKKTKAALAGVLRPVTRPDVDQYVKAGLDGCTGIVWRDDSQVVELVARKLYSVDPRLEIEVRSITTIADVVLADMADDSQSFIRFVQDSLL